MNNDDLTLQVSPDNVAIVKDEEKCIKCGLCSYICPANINLGGSHEQ